MRIYDRLKGFFRSETGSVRIHERLVVDSGAAKYGLAQLTLLGGYDFLRKDYLEQRCILRRSGIGGEVIKAGSDSYKFKYYFDGSYWLVKAPKFDDERGLAYARVQLEGQRLMLAVGFGQFAPLLGFELDGIGVVVQRFVGGGPVANSKIIRDLLKPCGLLMSDAHVVGNAIYNREFGVVLIDFSEIRREVGG